MKREIWLLMGWLSFVAAHAAWAEHPRPDVHEPIVLEKAVHLLLDDYFIAHSEGVERKVISPQRFLAEPIVTGALQHQNWQPFFTVLPDPTVPSRKPFRMWYNVDVFDDPADDAWYGATGFLESSDGIRWTGPYERLNSLKDDGSVRFGASVVDDGPSHPTTAERYKMLYFDAGRQVGPRVAFSPDGLQWTLYDGGKPVHRVNNGEDIWSAGFDPLRQRYFLIGKVEGPYTWTNAEGKKLTANIRRSVTSFSRDFKTWSEPKLVFSPDEKDSGVTQSYGIDGFSVRGDLIVAFLRVLRDDLSPEGVPPEAVASNAGGKAERRTNVGVEKGAGMGYTVLAWTRDGETWQRDRHTDKFFEPDPRPGAWDHAMSWVGSSVSVGDEVYLYYAGYRWGHKYRRSVDRQLGVVKTKRDRFVAREAGNNAGTITTPTVTLRADTLALNVDAQGGAVRVQITTAGGEPIPGFRFQDCQPIATDSLSTPLAWKQPLSALRGRSVRLEFSLKNARLFAFESR
ncbi:MAG: hypothetical protein HZA46_13440 [Planctomycetales bacterium]|nr:hypothetical protein [Planctomycetales bacterium]